MPSHLHAQPDDTVGDAFGQMEALGVTVLPVVDAKRRVLGTVTEQDLRRHVAQRGRTAMFASTLDDVLDSLPRAA
jgi:CBS domain-containing protein